MKEREREEREWKERERGGGGSTERSEMPFQRERAEGFQLVKLLCHTTQRTAKRSGGSGGSISRGSSGSRGVAKDQAQRAGQRVAKEIRKKH